MFATVENRLVLAHQIRIHISRNLFRFSWSFCTPKFLQRAQNTPNRNCKKNSISIQVFFRANEQKSKDSVRTSCVVHALITI